MDQLAPVGMADPVHHHTTTPAQPGFAALLRQQLAAASTPADAGEAPTVTLGQMLQLQAARPLVFAAPVTAPPTVAPPVPVDTGTGTYAMPVDGEITSEFGMRFHPILHINRMHNGVDIPAPEGTPIRAAAAGTVSFAGWQSGYGNIVIIRHPDGAETRYAHQSTLGVQSGDRVARAQVIGAVGSTGMSTGPHLHFEVRVDGEPVDPEPLLR